MARVAGVDLPPNKRAKRSVHLHYGITLALNSVLKEAGVNLDTRVRDLSEDELSRFVPFWKRRERSKATCASVCRWTSSA